MYKNIYTIFHMFCFCDAQMRMLRYEKFIEDSEKEHIIYM